MDKISMKTDIYLGQGALDRLAEWQNQRIQAHATTIWSFWIRQRAIEAIAPFPYLPSPPSRHLQA